tara:strand:- start:2608 stop:2850 length:243 start_codon:yes stop_codon:yes gene_type:complete
LFLRPSTTHFEVAECSYFATRIFEGRIVSSSSFEFLNVNELSMDQLVIEEVLMLLALKYFKKKKLGMVGEEGFEPPTNGV